MKKKLLSCVIVLSLALSMISTNAFVVDTRALSRADVIENVVDGLKKDVEKFHRTHTRDKSGNRMIINEDYKAPKKSKSGSRFPSKYIAPYTSIKDQNTFSSCWMFGELSSLESNLMLRDGYGSGMASEDPIDLSEAQGVYVQYNRETVDGTLNGEICSDSDNDVEQFISGYYGFQDGGWPLDASMALTANKGAALESENPYISQSSGTRTADSRTMATKAAASYRTNHFDIETAEQLPEVFAVVASSRREYNPDTRDIWKDKLCQRGALSANYMQDNGDKYHHGWGLDETKYKKFPNYWMFDANARGKFGTNHVITIVGYDDDYSKYNFMEPYTDQSYDETVGELVYIKIDEANEPKVEFDENGHLVSIDTSATEQEGYAPFIVPLENGAWIIKNSYGKQNGDKKVYYDGIMYMSYCEQTLSEVISSEVLEELDQIKNGEKTFDTTLSHSSLQGDYVTSGFNKGDKAAEVYSIDSDKDFELGQIGYWTGKANTTTKVEVYDNLANASNPESGTLVYSSSEITDAYEGYHTIKLNDEVTLTHGTNASVIVTQINGNNSALMIEADYATPSNADYFFNCNEGDTFYYTRGEWFTREEIDEKARQTELTIANSTVKLFGNAKEVEPPKYKITVDGVEEYVEVGDQYTFPATSNNGYANADYTTLYAPGQVITPEGDITVESIKDIDFEMEAGASVDLRGNDGLRFCADVTYEDDDFLNSDNVELGTLLTPEDTYIDFLDEKLDLDTAEQYGDNFIAKVVNSGWRYGNVGSFAAGIIHLKEYNWRRSFVAKAYMKINYSDGSEKVLYTDLSDSRSITQVVENLRDMGYPGLSDDQIAMLQKYLQ
ncbi:MAG: hypothetical protein J6W35_04300 [Eubacterium sp.]|nr:hypothetical protein [Eubacterium sp.]